MQSKHCQRLCIPRLQSTPSRIPRLQSTTSQLSKNLRDLQRLSELFEGRQRFAFTRLQSKTSTDFMPFVDMLAKIIVHTSAFPAFPVRYCSRRKVVILDHVKTLSSEITLQNTSLRNLKT